MFICNRDRALRVYVYNSTNWLIFSSFNFDANGKRISTLVVGIRKASLWNKVLKLIRSCAKTKH